MRGEFVCSGVVFGGWNVFVFGCFVCIREGEVVVVVFVVVVFFGSMGNDFFGGGDFSGGFWFGVVVCMIWIVIVVVNVVVGGGSVGVIEGGDVGVKSDVFEYLVENNDGK